MAAKGKGVDYYKSTYTHQQLWDMLHEGDDYAVERAGSVWVTAASGMKAAREELTTHVESLRLQWTGPASDEFDGRMNLVKQYSVQAENGMQTAGEQKIPALAEALKSAQDASTSLNPAFIEEYEDWVESTKHVDPASAEAQSKKTQWEQEYQTDLNKNHEEMAQIVANLGDIYAAQKDEFETELPPPPPSDMPGNNTYTKPTGGVFSETALSGSDSLGSMPADQAADLDGDGFADSPDDFDPVENDWNYGSYDDVDSNVTGGLASGGVIPGGGSGFSTVGGTGGVGGSTIPGGAGLFGPSQGGSGSTGSRGGAGSSPARAGANGGKTGSSPARSGANGPRGGNSGSRLSSASRNAIGRGGSGSNLRGGTRSGYNDDDDEETYTRETWLREDDVDWSQNNVRREELDDDDDE
ncbi:WXG100 family type VII secretion target [Glycomyces sp. NPDC048151]|uniref:WXG100 family type VII secretion target n=1 Tax=Glycomyces sp. NPDC048151 TaxID=3364002 RepID=UPI0037145A4F